MKAPNRYISAVILGLFETASILSHYNKPMTIKEYEAYRQQHYIIMNILTKAEAIEVK